MGKSWEMICVLNTSHPDAEGGSWKNLSFYVDNKLARDPMVQKYNETAIRLYVENATTSPHDPGSDYYSVSCKQNFVRGICVRHVYVGCKFLYFSIRYTIRSFLTCFSNCFDRPSAERDGFSVHILQLGAA